MGIIDIASIEGPVWRVDRADIGVEMLLSRASMADAPLIDDTYTGFSLGLTELGTAADLPALPMSTRAVILEVDPVDQRSIERIGRLKRAEGNLLVVAAVRDLGLDELRKLIHLGVLDVLAVPIRHDELGSVLDRIRSELSRATATAPTGHMIACIGSVGGVGTTALLTQAAAIFARHRPASGAALFDFDVQSGCAASYLGLNAPLDVGDLLEAGKRVDGELMRSVGVSHATGLTLFAAPDEIMPLEHVGTDDVCDLISVALQDFATVFVDLPKDWTNWSLSLVARARAVFLIVELSVASLRQARRQLASLERLGVGNDKIHVVVNRVDKTLFRPIDLTAAATALGRPITLSIARDAAVMGAALDRGVTIDEVRRGGALSRDLARLADAFHHVLSDD